jgi:hypothetical protein
LSPHPRRPNKICEWCRQSYYPKTSSAQRYCSKKCSRATQVLPRRPVGDRFWEKVVKTEGCWLWTGAHDKYGYGSIRTGGRTFKAYRVGYELQCGPIPPGGHVCHRCDNPPCVRGDHLFIGDHAANMADMRAKGRMRTPKVHGVHNANATLTDEIALEIIARGDRGERHADIASALAISKPTVQHVLCGRTWSHVTGRVWIPRPNTFHGPAQYRTINQVTTP